MLICDGFGSHETLEILEFCLTNNMEVVRKLTSFLIRDQRLMSFLWNYPKLNYGKVRVSYR